MHLTNESLQESFVINIKGNIDATTSVLVDSKINKIYGLPFKNLWIDCREVQHISSAGAGVFMSHLQKLKEHKITLTIYGLKPKLKSVFTVLGLEHYFTLQPALSDLPVIAGQE